MKRFPFLTALTFLCFTVTSVVAADVFNSEGHFTATLPTEWIEIPKSVLEDHVRSLERQMPQMAGQLTEFSFGYQLKDAEWFSYPYCIGYINRRGRGNESELIKWTKNDFMDVFEKGLKYAKDGQKPLIQDATFGIPVYDAKEHILWYRLTAKTSAMSIDGIVAQLLTNEGYIKFRFYCASKDFQTYLPTFKFFVENITLPESLKYK